MKTVAVDCPQCGAREAAAAWSGREHEYEGVSDDEFTFVRCTACDVIRLDPRPDVSELGRIYPPEYYAYNYEPSTGPPRSFTDKLKARVYVARIERLATLLGRDGRIRLLDVGCGDGRLLNWYRSSRAVGDRLDTFGIEMDERAAERARAAGHEVIAGRFELDTQLEAGSFDLIMALHVIEHVDDPTGFARRASELLAPGGILTIATPNVAGLDARLFKGTWGGNHFPRHWTMYDPSTIRDLAERIGLEVHAVAYEANPIFWVWSLHATLRRRFPHRKWPDRLFPPVKIFEPSPRSLVLLGTFTVLDHVLRLTTRRTGSMVVALRKSWADQGGLAPAIH